MSVTSLTSIRPNNPRRGWVLFDGECRLCIDLAKRFEPVVKRAGFELLPLQSVVGRTLLAGRKADLLREMAVVTPGGKVHGGAEACYVLSQYIWWARPFRLLFRIPGGRATAHLLYGWIAANRHCYRGVCQRAKPPERRLAAGTSAIVALLLPVIAFLAARTLQPWLLMWSLAIAIFFACKLLMLANRADSGSNLRGAGQFLFLWPGMDPRPFLEKKNARNVNTNFPRTPWVSPVARMTVGAVLLWAVVPAFASNQPLLAGWTGMVGLILLLHFGLFHLVALGWQRLGVDARPLMNSPLRSASLADFWGGRWNRGFSDLSRELVYRRLWRRIGATNCTWIIFLLSGLIHDLVISLPARGSYGLPTLYFLIQGAAMLFERSETGKRLGLGSGIRGRIFAGAVLLGPLFWLFHPPFVERVILPFLQTIGSA